ncbi:amino acid permease [Paraconexibacter sp.]|uniref:amino acid permease n=1 Tax=Paraconexibacter sp. TaxID=2949640 RepID=UPI003561E2FD
MSELRRDHRFHLFVAFAFTVMADPVSSVTYAIEAALGRLDGDLAGIATTMALVVAIIALVAATYTQLVRRFPRGGGGPEAMAVAFGEGWAFVPLGALIVDFTLTIAVSCAAGASALIAWVPELADGRTVIAVVLASAVAIGCLDGHRGRIGFATSVLVFLGLALAVIVRGAIADPTPATVPVVADVSSVGLGAILLAMPLGMALATGLEAPSNAIAQLEQLDDRGRRTFGTLTIWLLVAIVGALTLAFAALAARLGETGPQADSTLLADIARNATGGDLHFDLFQIASALLLLAAAASSFIAGSGLLEALARDDDTGPALLPTRLAATNKHFAPPWGIALLLGLAVGLIVAAGGRDTTLVQFYAAAVFASFCGALIAAAVLNLREGRLGALAVNVAGLVPVAFVLALNLGRGDPIAAIGAALIIALVLWRRWIAAGRPGGVVGAVR